MVMTSAQQSVFHMLQNGCHVHEFTSSETNTVKKIEVSDPVSGEVKRKTSPDILKKFIEQGWLKELNDPVERPDGLTQRTFVPSLTEA